MNPDYNKKRYLQLLDQRSIGDNSNNDELLRYSCMLTNQLYWEIRDQYLSLMERSLNGNICMSEFFAELRIKNYAIMDAVDFLEKHRILLSFDKKASKFEELLEDILDESVFIVDNEKTETKIFVTQETDYKDCYEELTDVYVEVENLNPTIPWYKKYEKTEAVQRKCHSNKKYVPLKARTKTLSDLEKDDVSKRKEIAQRCSE